jgi:hypothetical protein
MPYAMLVAGGLVFGVGVLRSNRYIDLGGAGYRAGTSSMCFVGVVICVGAIIWSLM